MCCVCALYSPCLIGLGWHGDAVKVRIFLHHYWGEKKLFQLHPTSIAAKRSRICNHVLRSVYMKP